MTPPRTALVIAMPEAQARFGDMRRRYDPQARLGVPAHVTILFPFMPPALVDADVRRRLQALFERHAPFTCRLIRVERFPATTYLAPESRAPFVELTRAVAAAFPECPPYGGAHAGVVPHLTIADGDTDAADLAEGEARAELERNGPVTVDCASVTMLEDSAGRWRAMLEFPLIGRNRCEA